LSNPSNHLLSISYFGEIGPIPKSSAWSSLIDELKALGVLVWEDGDVDPTHILAIDYSPYQSAYLSGFPRNNRLLCATEPRAVSPKQFSRLVRRRFAGVLVPSDLYPLLGGEEIWEGGYLDLRRNGEFFAANDGNRLGYGMVNQNKFSMVQGSNYALRTRVVRYATKHRIPLRVGGADWDRGLLWTVLKLLHHTGIALAAGHLPRLRNLALPLSMASRELLVGAVESDVEFLSHKRIALVIENESTYVSEKIFTALQAGCQCVYVGPQLNKNEFPDGFLFQAEARVDDIFRKIHIAHETPYQIDAGELRSWIYESTFAKNNSTSRRNKWIAQRVFDWIFESLHPR